MKRTFVAHVYVTFEDDGLGDGDKEQCRLAEIAASLVVSRLVDGGSEAVDSVDEITDFRGLN